MLRDIRPNNDRDGSSTTGRLEYDWMVFTGETALTAICDGNSAVGFSLEHGPTGLQHLILI